MIVKVGTFNLNNLFSRFNFKGRIDAVLADDTTVTVTYSFDDPAEYNIRTFMGRLVVEKDPARRLKVAERIKAMDLDVLAVQEVEDLSTLEHFNRTDLAGMYPYQVLIEGNDPRLIDVGLLSKLPIGGVTSWRFATHKAEPDSTVFSRDLLEADIWDAKRRKRLFTIFNTHLKSQYLAPQENPITGKERADLIRTRQSETAAAIIAARTRPNTPFLLLGDMNDVPIATPLAAIAQNPDLPLVNGLANPQETQPTPHDPFPPASAAWTHRFKESGQPARYDLFDQIWLSPALAPRQTAAWIKRRSNLTGEGSDHDPAWVEVDV